MKIVAIYDLVAKAYMNPVTVSGVGPAIRGFGDEVAKTDGNPLAMHPKDHELHLFGDWDAETGIFTILDEPQCVARGADYVKA